MPFLPEAFRFCQLKWLFAAKTKDPSSSAVIAIINYMEIPFKLIKFKFVYLTFKLLFST
jgi:hypothetical protein